MVVFWGAAGLRWSGGKAGLEGLREMRMVFGLEGEGGRLWRRRCSRRLCSAGVGVEPFAAERRPGWAAAVRGVKERCSSDLVE